MDSNIMAIPQNEPAEIIMGDMSVDLIIARAEKSLEVMKKVLGIAIKRTNPKDWVDQGGKPYLTCSGAEKIAPLFGIKVEGVVSQRDEREDEKGKYYLYSFIARFKWAAGDIEAIGVCSSRDKFFSWDGTKKEWKALSEFDEGNIKKAAYSNMMANGITRVLGIRNLTWADLEEYGVKRDEAAKVDYNKGAHADPSKAGLISEAQAKRLYAIATSVGLTPETLKSWLKEHYKLESSKDIPWKQYETICNQILDIKASAESYK